MRTTLPALVVLAACSGYVLAFIGPEWEVGADALKLLCIVGIVKGLVHFTGPLLFAVAKPFYRATMLWFFAAVSVATVVAVGYTLEGETAQRQLNGMSGARALVALAVVVPLNLFIISRIAGLRPRTLARWLPAPLAAGISAILAVAVLTQTGALDAAPPVVALLVAGGVAVALAGTMMLALDPEARRLAQRLLATRRSSAAGTSPGSG
jgi:O-antigen/teichoic acid export membrane protein